MFSLQCYIATSLQRGYEIPEGEQPLQRYLHCITESVKAETARMWEVSCNKNPTAWMNNKDNATDCKKAQTKNTPSCYSATALQTRREHLISELRATRYTATMLQTEKKAQTKNTPPCYSATPLQTRREHLISELRANRYTATMLQTEKKAQTKNCLLYTSPSPRDRTRSRMPSSA